MNQPNKQDLAELFYKDPEKLTVEDRSAIVAVLREKREAFVASEAKAKPRASATAKPKAAPLVNLGDLGL